MRRGHFSILRQAITETGGTEVKNLGAGVMAVFSSASAALDCGVAMQQGVDHDNRVREHAVGLRVGLSGGEVSWEDDDYFGVPWSRRPGCVHGAKVERFWLPTWSGPWPDVAVRRGPYPLPHPRPRETARGSPREETFETALTLDRACC